MSLGAMRNGRSSRNTQLAGDIAQKLSEINDRNSGTMSNKRLTGKLNEAFEGLDASVETVPSWCKDLG